MGNRIFGLFGTGGFAREVMPLATLIARDASAASFDRCVFVDVDTGPKVNGTPQMSEHAFLAEQGERFFNLAISDATLRRKLAELAIGQGAIPQTLIAPNATLYAENQIGEGAIICANTVITSNAKIGRFFHLNIFSYVAHDCEIGDFVTFAPKVCCNGNVVIEDGAYIGTGAILRQGQPGHPLRIGAGATVGMGAVVTRDVAAGVTVVGCPARPLHKDGAK